MERKPEGPLRRGWTTGACATAATKAAYTALVTGDFPDPVTITLPGGERRKWLENNGFLRHYAELDDALKWRAIRYLCEVGTPPPPWSVERLQEFANCRFHPAEPWQGVAEGGGAARVTTPKAAYDFDFLIFGTGIAIDINARHELRAFASC